VEQGPVPTVVEDAALPGRAACYDSIAAGETAQSNRTASGLAFPTNPHHPSEAQTSVLRPVERLCGAIKKVRQKSCPNVTRQTGIFPYRRQVAAFVHRPGSVEGGQGEQQYSPILCESQVCPVSKLFSEGFFPQTISDATMLVRGHRNR
jgi:hypothetical protein